MRKDTYDEAADLLKDIRLDIEDVLSKEVLNEVRDIELRHIQKDVFDVYTPKIYERRTIDGIDDPRNIVGIVNDNMELEVINVTEFNSGYGTGW